MASRETRRSSPYQGLIPYSEQDAPFFFGREKEARLIAANLFASSLTLLYGASGVGKSSVLRAGVAHQLRTREDLLVVVFNSWQSHPAYDLMQAISDQIKLVDPAAWERIYNQLPEDNEIKPYEFLAICADELKRRLMIILDQFEEYFLYHPVEDDFATAFAKAVTSRDLPISFLISIREDFYAKLDRFEGRIPSLYDNYLRIEHLDRAAARTAIEKPINEYNRRLNGSGQFNLEPELVTAVLSQVETGQVIIGETGRGVIEAPRGEGAKARIETPFLQLVMTRLWDAEREANSQTLRLQTLDQLGGAANIVRTHLDAVLGKLNPREQEIAANIFHYLVTPSGTKIAYTASDLAGSAELNEMEVVEVLERLTHGDVRILRPVDPTPERPGVPRYEIFHDVLAPAILAWRNMYVQGQERAETENKLAAEAAERALAEQRLARERMMVRRQRLLMFALLLVLIAVLGLTAYAFQQRSAAVSLRQAAEQQRAAAVSAESEAVKERDRANSERSRAEAALISAQRAQTDAENQKKRAEHSQTQAETAQKATAQALVQTKRAQTALEQRQRQLVEQKTRAEQAQAEAESAQDSAETAAREAGRQKLRAEDALKVAQSRELAASAISQLSVDPELSLLLAKEAIRAGRTTEAEQALRQSLIQTPVPPVLRDNMTGSVTSASFSPDGKFILTAGRFAEARLWDVSTGQLVKKLDAGGMAIFSPDGKSILAYGSEEGSKPRVVDVSSGKTRVTLEGGYGANFSVDGKLIVTTDVSKATVWDAFSGRRIQEVHGHSNKLTEAVLSPDGKLVAAGDWDQTVNLWEASTGKSVFEMRGHKREVNSVVFSPDGKLIVSSGKDRTARVWDVATGETVKEIRVRPPQNPDEMFAYGVTSATFSPDGKLIAIVFDDTVQLWEVGTWRSVAELGGEGVAFLTPKPAFSPDGKFIVTPGLDGAARVWEVNSGRNVKELRGHQGAVACAAFSPDGRLVVTGGHDSTARVWDAALGVNKIKLTGDLSLLEGKSSFNPDSSQVVTAGPDTIARVWDPATGQLRLELRGHEKPVKSATFSHDGKFILTVSQDGRAIVWDAATGKSLKELRQPPPPVSNPFDHEGLLADGIFSPDDRFIVTVGNFNKGRVWDVAAGKSLFLVGGGGTNEVRVVFSPDGRFLVTSSEGSAARVWDMGSAQKVAELKGEEELLLAVFSNDGKLLATAGRDDSVRIWDTNNWQLLKALTGKPGPYWSIGFSPDNKLLVAANFDKVAYVWDLGSARVVRELQGHQERVSGAVFSDDGRLILTTSQDDNSVRVWEVSTGRTVTELPRDVDSLRAGIFSPGGKYVALTTFHNSTRIYRWETFATRDALIDLITKRKIRDLTPEERIKFLHETGGK